MKILIIGTGRFSDNYGGGQIYIRNLIHALVARNHDIYYLSLLSVAESTPKQLWFVHDNFKECQLKLPQELMYSFSNSGESADLHHLTSIIEAVSPEIVHANGCKQIISIAAKSLGIPCVVTAHHGGIVCPAGALLNEHDQICAGPAGQMTCLPCCTRSIPGGQLWLSLVRLMSVDIQLRLGRWMRSRQFLYFVTPLGTMALSIHEKLAGIETLGRCATRLIAPSPAIRYALVRSGIPAGKVVVIPHGIPLSQRRPLRSNLEKGPVRFLFVGRISHVKGVHVMLAAFSELPPEAYELHIVGGAVTKPERRYLARLQRRYSSVNAVWHGSRSHEEIPQHIAACDVMVHPAIFLEVFGLTIAEALAVGRPVIASRCGGAEAQIRDGENGLLVPPNNALALRFALKTLLDERYRIRSMAAPACEVVSIERHIQDLEQLYTDLL